MRTAMSRDRGRYQEISGTLSFVEIFAIVCEKLSKKFIAMYPVLNNRNGAEFPSVGSK